MSQFNADLVKDVAGWSSEAECFETNRLVENTK